MFKRKLFKRALPIILSVAMVFQSAPTTAFAAESTTEPETVIEQSTEEVVDDDADDNKEGGDEADGGQNEGGNEESKSPETQTTEETKTAETQTAEENKDAEAEEEVVDNAEATASKAVISVNENTLVSNLSGYTYDYTTKTVEKSFIPDSTQTAKDVLAAADKAVKVTVDEQDNSTAKAHVSYKWQQKNAEGNFADMPAGELPQAAGEYKLVISLGDVEGVCAAADDAAVNLMIKKAEIIVDRVSNRFNPGVTVAEVKERNADFKIKLKENSTLLEKDAYISASTIEVKDAAGTVLADTAVLEKDKDYTLNINMTLKDEFAKNYEVKSEPVNIIFNNAFTTEIKVTYKKEGETIGKTYDGKAIDAATEVESKYDAKVVYTKDGEKTELAGAKLTATWCNADGVAYVDIDEEKYKDFKPVDAGTYIYRLSYTDETGTYTYKDATADVKVVISMVDVVIDPVLDAKEYSEGTEASAILKSVKYDVYEVKDGVKAEKPMSIDKNYFWGTSYNINLSDDEQYYAPVFEVQKGVKESNGTVTWGAILDDNDKLVSGENVVYRVVFSGEKAVYYNGNYYYETDINESQQNYTVDVTDSARSAYAEDITLTAAVEIDVTPILEDGKGAEYENAMIRTYDGKAKYKTRGDYKKATAKAGDKTLDASNLVYTWEKAYDYRKVENKWVVKWSDLGSFNSEVEDYSNPVNAGEYRLKVEYKDAKNGLSSNEPKYVYYTILPQNVKGVVTGTPKAYADDIKIGDFIESLQHDDKTAVNTYVEAAVVKVNEDGTTGDDISSEFDLDNCYENPATYFDVVRKIDEGEIAGKWESVADDAALFILGKEYEVRLVDNRVVGNYNFGKKLDNHGQPVADAEPLYENAGAKVEVLNSSLIELEFDIDESQITNNVKVYDAKPFDLTALKSLVKVTNRKDGSAVTDAEVKYELLVNPTFDPTYGYLTDATETWAVEDAIHGGTYKLHIFVETNDKYRYSEKVLSTPFEIKKAKLTVTPKVKDEIKAGVYAWQVFVGDGTGILADEPEITGYVGEDADLLTGLRAYVHAENSTSVLSDYLRSGKTYYVEYTANFISADYGARDYELVCERASFVPVRAEAIVRKDNTALYDEISGTPDKGYTHTITTKAGIPYNQGLAVTVNGKSETIEGNIFTFYIYAPMEFQSAESTRRFNNNTFVYRNSIEKAGGYVIDADYNYVKVAFKADPEKLNEKKTFEILWDTDYSEEFTIDFSQSILEDDMTKAVAPKSLAFNGANTKMAVGDTQQLDVKITKNQMRDIILLNYESSDESVLKVTDKGYVTALKKGSATVSVYPCYKDKDDKKVAIKGAKAATVKITVSDVAAPKISKVTTKGTRATVTYQKPANGYRREIYVLEGKKNVADFEAAIAKVINGDYSAFVVADLTASETPDKKGNVTLTVRGLSPKSEYTVYVRNVSGLRALEDGSQVASSYAGAVKTFKTTKANASGLYTYFKQGDGQTAIEVANAINKYEANLKDKSAQLSVDAKFLEKYSQKYSDSADYIWRTLPLAGSDKDNYEEPTISYFVVDPYDVDDTRSDMYCYGFDGTWYRGTKLATVDKKGKVTFNGKGEVRIFAVDTAQTGDGVHAYVDLIINASPDSVKGKNIKMSVGQGIYLSHYLEYKEGKNKVENYQYDYADLSIDKESDENFYIVRWGGDYWIRALNPGAKLTLKVTDSVVKANKGSDTTVTITTTAINPVKGLKVQSVDDQKFTVTYSYPLNGFDFRFDLKDSSGKVIDSVIATNMTGTWNTKTKACDYTKTFNNAEITRLSSYSLTVTALFNGQESKPAKLNVKTTNIPASYRDLGKEGNESNSTPIIVTTKSTGQIKLSDYPVLKSGNTYTLDVPLTGSSLDNRAARDRKTDTLTWKSTNPKVATVKANAGSYTATLKALQKGETIIEVTSKITKKVIARYTVTINAVGEAGGYFGDNEPYKGSDTGISNVVIDEKDMIELTMNNSIKYSLNKGEGQWYVFTAPAYGEYTFSSQQSAYVYSDKKVLLTRGTSNTEWLDKGTKRYLYIEHNSGGKNSKLSGSVSVTGTMYTELTLGENKVKGGANVVFIAPTDNHYVISYDENGNTNKNEYDLTAGVKQTLTIGSTGKDYVVKVSCREADKTVVGGDGAAVSLGEGAEKWFSFTADETGIYTFYTTGATDNISGSVHTSLKDTSSTGTTGLVGADASKDYKSNEIMLEKGQTVYIKFTAAGATKDKAVTATFKVDKAPSVGADGKAGATTEANKPKTITYVIPSQGDYRFTFTATPADAKITTGTVTVNNISKPINNNVFEDTFAKNAFVQISVTTDKAATVSVAVEKTTKKVLSIGENKVNLAANATETVAFYATNTGCYTFKFAPAVEPETTEYLVAGGKKEFKLTSATAQEVTVTVSKADVATLTAGDVTVGTNATKYFKYTATKEGLYSFGITKDENVSVTESDSLAFTTTTNKYIDKGAIYMTAGETFYVKISSTEAAAATAKATVTIDALQVTALTAGTETPIEIEASKSAWVEFTAKKDARYAYTKQDATGFAIEKYNSLGDEKDNNYRKSFSDSVGEVIKAGTKQYFKVTNNNTAKQTIKLTISEIVPVAAGQSAQLGNGEGKWFEFSADAAARYTFSGKAEKDGKTPSAAITASVNKITGTLDDLALSSGVFKQGEKYYFYIKATCDEADTVAVSLKTVKAGQDGELTAADGIEFKADALTKTLTWTAPETGWYRFSAKVGNEEIYRDKLTFDFYRNLSDTKENADWTEPCESGTVISCDAGDKFTFVVTSKEPQTVKFAMSKETVIPVTSTETEVKMNAGDQKLFSFKEKEVARYYIELTNISDGLVLLGDDFTSGGSAETLASNGYITFVGSVDGEYVFAIRTESKFEGEKSFKIKGGVVAPTALAAGTPATIAKDSVVPNHYMWYKFTAPEDGRYAFKLANASAVGITIGYPLTTSYLGTVLFPAEYVFKKDQTVYFAIFSEVAPENDVTFSVTKPVATELTESSPLTIDISKVESTERVWASFTAPADGYYTFAADRINVFAETYESIDKYDHETSILPFESFMEAGDTVLYALTYSGTLTQNITVSVKKAEPVALTAGTEKELTFEANEYKYLTFTADKDVVCTVKTVDASDIKFCEMKDDVSGSESATLSEIIVPKGKTVTLKARNTGAKATVKVLLSTVELKALAEGENEITFGEAETEKWVVFTPAQNGEYSFEADSNNTYAIYSSVNEGLNFNQYYYVAKCDTIRVKITADAGSKAKLTVTKAVGVSINTIALGEEKTVYADSGNGNIATFTAPETATYVFYSVSESDPDAYVYLDQKSTYDGNTGDFRISYKLKAGQTVFIESYNYEGDSLPYTIGVKKSS